MTTTFSADGVSSVLNVPPGSLLALAISGTWVARIALQQRAGLNAWADIKAWSGSAVFDASIDLPAGDYRLRCSGYVSGTATYVLGTSARTLKEYLSSDGVSRWKLLDDGTITGPVTGTVQDQVITGLFGLTGFEDSLTAHAGGTQAAALALSSTKTVHRVSVCATNADSVKLPTGVVGAMHVVINDGAATLQVFGSGTETIDAVATATGVAVAAAKRAFFYCYAAGLWVSLKSA